MAGVAVVARVTVMARMTVALAMSVRNVPGFMVGAVVGSVLSNIRVNDSIRVILVGDCVVVVIVTVVAVMTMACVLNSLSDSGEQSESLQHISFFYKRSTTAVFNFNVATNNGECSVQFPLCSMLIIFYRKLNPKFNLLKSI